MLHRLLLVLASVAVAPGLRAEEAQKGAQAFTCGAQNHVVLKTFADGFMPYIGKEVKGLFEEMKTAVSPDLIFTHYRKDAHQDHRLLSELTWNTWRNHAILEYEIPKYEAPSNGPHYHGGPKSYF